jgi:hypothetical protein
MRRISRSILLAAHVAALGAATACDLDEPTAPPNSPARPPRDVEVVTSLASLLGKTTVDDAGFTGQFASLASGADGVQRIAYGDVTNHRFKYATCSANCGIAANWQTAVVDQAAGLDLGTYGSLQVQSGVIHATYHEAESGQLRYAACSSGCLVAEDWKKVVIDDGPEAGLYTSLAVGGSGGLGVSYYDVSYGHLKHASCAASCTSAANWQTVTVDQSPSVGLYTSTALGADGRRHISYFDAANGDLKYATCALNCTNPANWLMVAVDQTSQVGRYTSIAVDANGVRHISYYDALNKDLKYARCATNCTNSAGWSRVTVDKGAGATGTTVGEFSSLAVGPGGKVHVSYYDRTAGRLKYASCGADCLLNPSWERQVVDGGCNFLLVCNNVGGYTSLRLAGGKVHISYYSFSKQDLKYVELTS